MNVAQLYPVREQSNGTRWYRPADLDGWTSQRALAHPDYHNQEDTMTDLITTLSDDGTLGAPLDVEERFTQWSRYPLPPEPPRVKVVYDGWGRYKLPSPSTGRPTAFTRATTVAGTLDDTYNINRWKTRETVKALIALMHNDARVQEDGFDTPEGDHIETLRRLIRDEDKGGIDKLLDHITNVAGGRDAAELGEAVHAWLEAVDIRTVLPRDVPEMFQPYLTAYLELLARHGLRALPQYVERIAINERGEQTIVGTLDRIYQVIATGELILGDVKTSKTLEYGYLTYAVQMAVYGYAEKLLKIDGSGWEPMPELNSEFAIIMHVPSDQPERASAVTLDLWYGGESMILSLEARRRRTEAKKKVPFVHPLPIPIAESLRIVAAEQSLLHASDVDELSTIWETYQDVWNDDLNELGNDVAQLLDPALASA